MTHTGSMDGGLAHISLIDPRGNRLFGRTDTPQFSFWGGIGPIAGEAGTWAIEVQLEDVVGVVNYHVTGDPLGR